MNRRGLTLLEVMVALVILGLVVLGYVQVFGAAARSVRGTDEWSRAVVYAEQGMEMAKLDVAGAIARGREPLEGGFERQVTAHPAEAGLRRVSVTVRFPGGGQWVVDRLVEGP